VSLVPLGCVGKQPTPHKNVIFSKVMREQLVCFFDSDMVGSFA